MSQLEDKSLVVEKDIHSFNNEINRNGLNNYDADEDSGWDTDLDCEDAICHSGHGQNNKDCYLAACKECGVIPTSYFLRNMNNVRLNMAHYGLGVNGVKALSISLLTNTHLTGLDLCDNLLGCEGVNYVCQMLIENCYITNLDLSENNIGVKGVKHICDVLNTSNILKQLSVSGNCLDAKSAAIFSETLMHNASLKQLNLSHNCFDEEAGLHFAAFLAQNEFLEELDLSWNSIRQKGAFAIGKSLKENITLKKLDLSWNGFGDDGIYVLSEALKINGSLQQLNISANRVSHVGAAHIKKALAENEGLVVFKVGRNPFQHGSLSILQGLMSNENSTIVELDFSEIQVSQEFISLLENLHSYRPHVEVYHGGLGGSPQKGVERPKPMRVLRNYIKHNQMRVLDFFKSLDKDKSMSVSVPEFVAGLKEAGVPLRQDELMTLVQSLDLNGDGEIDYKEMVTGNEESAKEEREQVLKDKADQDRKRQLSKNLKPSVPSGSTTLNPPRTLSTPFSRPRAHTERSASALGSERLWNESHDTRIRSHTEMRNYGNISPPPTPTPRV